MIWVHCSQHDSSHNSQALRSGDSGYWQRLRGRFNVTSIMRTPLEIPPHLIKQAELYAPGRAASDAVCHILEDYPRLVSQVRKLRAGLAEFEQESSDFDRRLALLQDACRQILDL